MHVNAGRGAVSGVSLCLQAGTLLAARLSAGTTQTRATGGLLAAAGWAAATVLPWAQEKGAGAIWNALSQGVFAYKHASKSIHLPALAMRA